LQARGRHRRDHRRHPARRDPAQEDIAEAIVFFASDMSRMITGQSLDVNGGEFFS
jgi:NAD(P)-dependent dehydrogenase (short-subunit alcohol dehydrogenase family)